MHAKQEKNDGKSDGKNDIVIQALRDKYFKLIVTEKIGITSGISNNLDNLEEAIRELMPKKVLDTEINI